MSRLTMLLLVGTLATLVLSQSLVAQTPEECLQQLKEKERACVERDQTNEYECLGRRPDPGCQDVLPKCSRTVPKKCLLYEGDIDENEVESEFSIKSGSKAVINRRTNCTHSGQCGENQRCCIAFDNECYTVCEP